MLDWYSVQKNGWLTNTHLIKHLLRWVFVFIGWADRLCLGEGAVSLQWAIFYTQLTFGNCWMLANIESMGTSLVHWFHWFSGSQTFVDLFGPRKMSDIFAGHIIWTRYLVHKCCSSSSFCGPIFNQSLVQWTNISCHLRSFLQSIFGPQINLALDWR